MTRQPQPEIPKELRGTVGPVAPQPPLPESPADSVPLYRRMVDSVRSWGRALLVLGGLHMITSGFLSATWGVMLVLVGAASLYFQDAAMFLLYGMTIAWAAINNLFGGNLLWMVFAVLQAYWAFGLFRDFRRYRRVQAAYAAYVAAKPDEGPPPPTRAARVFPWASLILGVLVIVAFVGGFAWLIMTPGAADRQTSPVRALLEMTPGLAVVGLGMGLGSFLLRYRPQLAAAIGMLGNSLVVLAWLALFILVVLP